MEWESEFFSPSGEISTDGETPGSGHRECFTIDKFPFGFWTFVRLCIVTPHPSPAKQSNRGVECAVWGKRQEITCYIRLYFVLSQIHSKTPATTDTGFTKGVYSNVAQRKRAGLITRRTLDRNQALLTHNSIFD
jgi:hypothetical protein